MNFEELKSRDVKDLRHLAAQYGIKVGGRAKAETIAKLIFEFVANKPKEQPKKAVEATKVPQHLHTEEEVRALIAKQLAKEGFVAEFPGDDTWIFKYRGAEESGHMSVAPRVIKTRADIVGRGAFVLRGLQDKKLNATSTSGIVMMV